MSRKGARGYNIDALPYRIRVYSNNQVLIPAKLVRALGIAGLKYADIVISFRGGQVLLRNVKLLRTRRTDSRQFTIPKEVREKLGIKPGDEIEVLEIRRARSSQQ